MESPVPDFCLIGAQKCGTTALARVLRSQPNIGMLPGELSTFDSPAESPGIQRPSRQTRKEVWGFKRPNILPSANAIRSLRAVNGGIRVIVLLRDPAQRAVAAAYHYMRDGFLPVCAMDSLLACLIRDGGLPGYPRSKEILEFGYYGRHLLCLEELLPRDQIFVADQQHLKTGDAEFFRQLSDFLGAVVRPVDIPSSMTTMYDPLRLRLRQYINGLLYSYNADRTRLRPRSRTLNAVVNRIDEAIPPRSSYRRPQISPYTIEALTQMYEPDVAVAREVAENLKGPGPDSGWSA